MTPFVPFVISIAFNIVDALKVTKSRKHSKSNLASIDFPSIYMCNAPMTYATIFIAMLVFEILANRLDQ